MTTRNFDRADEIAARQRAIEFQRQEIAQQVQALWAKDEQLSAEWSALLDEWMGIMCSKEQPHGLHRGKGRARRGPADR